MADRRKEKFKKQQSQIHERLLKIILQMYKPKIPPRPKEEEAKAEETVSPESSSSFENLLPEETVGPFTISKEKRALEAQAILQGSYQSLAQSYINGEISLEELKSKHFRINKILDPDKSVSTQKQTREVKKPCEKSREIPSSSTPEPFRKKWNFSNKVQRPTYLPLSATRTKGFKATERVQSIHKRPWCSFSKVDDSLITDNYRRVAVTNDRKEYKVPNLKHGGRLSAKSMHDMVVETVYPQLKPKEQPINTQPYVYEAVNSAKKRIVEYKVKNQRPKSRQVSVHLLRNSYSRSYYN